MLGCSTAPKESDPRDAGRQPAWRASRSGLGKAKSRLRLAGRASIPTDARKLRATAYVRALPLRAGSAGAQPGLIDPATVAAEAW